MSIASEITRLSSAKAALKDAIVAKGVEVADSLKLDQYASKVAAIPTGEPDPDAKYREGYGWNPPRDWPNLRKLVEELKPEDYGFPATHTAKRAYLADTNLKTVSLNGSLHYLCSDGATYTAASNYTGVNHTWDESKDIITSDGRHLKWIIGFDNPASPRGHFNWMPWRGMKNGASVLWIVGNITTLSINNDVGVPCGNMLALEYPSFTTNGLDLFQCKSLQYLRGDFADISYGDRNFTDSPVPCFEKWNVVKGEDNTPTITITAENCSTFSGSNIQNLVRVQNSSVIKKADNMYANCHFREIEDNLDLSNATSATSVFRGMRYLQRLPRNLKINLSFSFADSYGVGDKDSVATFAADGTVNGGMIGNLNTCVNAGQTVTLNDVIKALFTETEQTAIADCLTSKNWGLVW